LRLLMPSFVYLLIPMFFSFYLITVRMYVACMDSRQNMSMLTARTKNTPQYFAAAP